MPGEKIGIPRLFHHRGRLHCHPRAASLGAANIESGADMAAQMMLFTWLGLANGRSVTIYL
jgi:hypothetical protein